MEQFKQFIYNTGRYIIIGLGLFVGFSFLLKFYSPESPSIIFALIVLLIAECFALLLSNLALFVYTRIPFIHELKSGNPDFARIVGSVFVAVHVFVAIIIGLLYWGKI